MNRDEEETRRFLERLAGKPLADGSPPHPGLMVLRDALRAQAETERAAESATEADLTAEEKACMLVIKQHLIDRELLGAPVTKLPERVKPRSSLLQRLKETVFGSGWRGPVAVAASLMLTTLVVLEIALPPPEEKDIVRGAATPVIFASDPAAAAEAIAAPLREAGAEVSIVQINANKWSVTVEAPQSVDPVAIQKILKGAGVPVEGPPPYKLSIEAQR